MKITTLTNRTGYIEAHVTGCADIARILRGSDPWEIGPEVHEGPDLMGAIRDLDENWAASFCEVPYTDGAVDAGCWTLKAMKIAPCLKTLITKARITFDPRTGEPKAA